MRPWENPTRSPKLAETAAVFVLAVSATLLSQWMAGAYQAEPNGHPDEASHAVSGVMVGEYLRELAPEAPIQFAKRYYLHYPKVAIGHWPPAFHVLIGVWSIATSSSAESLLLWMALIGGSAATALYGVLRSELGPSLSFLVAIAWLGLPLSRWSTAGIMPDVLVAALCLAATSRYRAYLDEPGSRDAVLFGLLSAAALLTRGDAVALALLPPFTVLLLWRLDLVKRPDFWYPVPIVLAIAGPWHFGAGMFFPSPFGSWAYRATGRERPDSALGRLWVYTDELGWWLAAVCLAGLIAWGFRKERRLPGWAAAVGLTLAVTTCRLILTEHREARHALGGVASLMFGLACAAMLVAQWLPTRLRSRPLAAAAVGFALLAPSLVTQTHHVRKSPWGLRELARSIAERPDEEAVVLASGAMEGPLIAEAAMLEPKPRTVYLRATKVLADVGWNGRERGVRFESVETLREYLDGVAVGIVILDAHEGSSAYRHMALLREALADSSRWSLEADSTQFQVYRRTGPTPPRTRPIEIDLSSRGAGSLSLDVGESR